MKLTINWAQKDISTKPVTPSRPTTKDFWTELFWAKKFLFLLLLLRLRGNFHRVIKCCHRFICIQLVLKVENREKLATFFITQLTFFLGCERTRAGWNAIKTSHPWASACQCLFVYIFQWLEHKFFITFRDGTGYYNDHIVHWLIQRSFTAQRRYDVWLMSIWLGWERTTRWTPESVWAACCCSGSVYEGWNESSENESKKNERES